MHGLRLVWLQIVRTEEAPQATKSLGNSGGLSWVRHSSRESSATHCYQCVQYFRIMSTQWCGCLCWGFVTCAQMYRHRNFVRQSTLKVDSGREIPCCTGDSNPRQYCTWLFSQTLYQLSYFHPYFSFLFSFLSFLYFYSPNNVT